MAFYINNNVSAFNAYRNLGVNQDSMQSSLEKLSSGFRINKAADDAAGLSISEKLRSVVSGDQVATQNAQEGINLVQTADGALNEVEAILHRMRDLAVQANNGTNDQTARTAADQEFQAGLSEIDRIAQSTSFAGVALLNGGSVTFQVGSGNSTNDSINVSLATVSSSGLTLSGSAVSSAASAQAAISLVDSAIDAVSADRSGLGAAQNRLQHVVNNLGVAVQNLSASESAIRDTDMAKEMVNYSRAQILVQAGTAMLAQANQAPQSVLRLFQ